MIDITLLRIIKYREAFDKIYRYIQRDVLDKRTVAIADDFKKYFEQNEEESRVNFTSFSSMFFTYWHKNLKKEDADYFAQVLKRIEADVPDSIRNNIVNQMLELQFATELANVAQSYDNDEEIDILTVVENMVNTLKNSMEKATDQLYAGFDDSTVGEESEDEGLDWPLSCMNYTYRKIQGGDQYIVAARPGKGKTTFLTHLNWSLCKQLPENKVIVWFNNESRRQRIMSRQIQSALGKNNTELTAMQAAGTLKPAYIKEMGTADRVRVYDIHGKNNRYLEDILESVGWDNIGAIVIDMLDNVKFPTAKDMREDQRLEQLYQWSRELGVRGNCPVFPTSQISNEGAGLLFPSENMLKDSKTGKQGACDGIIMIGSSDDPMLQSTRGISMPKTKSKRAGQTDLREEVLFDADNGRYKG